MSIELSPWIRWISLANVLWPRKGIPDPVPLVTSPGSSSFSVESPTACARSAIMSSFCPFCPLNCPPGLLPLLNRAIRFL